MLSAVHSYWMMTQGNEFQQPRAFGIISFDSTFFCG